MSVLFRAKRLDNGQEVWGYYFYRLSVNMHWIRLQDENERFTAVEVDPATLEQDLGDGKWGNAVERIKELKEMTEETKKYAEGWYVILRSKHNDSEDKAIAICHQGQWLYAGETVYPEPYKVLVGPFSAQDVLSWARLPKSILDSETCEWEWNRDDSEDFQSDYYQTSCGNQYPMTVGTPADRKYKFCPHCGKEIKEIEASRQKGKVDGGQSECLGGNVIRG